MKYITLPVLLLLMTAGLFSFKKPKIEVSHASLNSKILTDYSMNIQGQKNTIIITTTVTTAFPGNIKMVTGITLKNQKSANKINDLLSKYR